MANLFRSTAGEVTVDNYSGPQYMQVSGVPGIKSGILSSVRISRNEVVQHIKTLTAAVYSYAFGEGVGKVSVSGILFLNSLCVGSASMGDINRQYDRNRVFSRPVPIILGIGGASLKAILVGLDMGAEASATPTAQFSMSFDILPTDTSG